MLAPATVLQNRYRIDRLLGSGGMGAVHQATDLKFGSKVAVKENLVSDTQNIKHLENEARLLNKLHHSALAKVYDFFSEGSRLFLVMEFIPGDDLHTVLEKRKARIEPKGKPKPFEMFEVLEWADQLLDALTYLHAHVPPILHRDIKPLNLKLLEGRQIILLDFGLAKQTKSIYGHTPGYSSLEQTMNVGTDARSDLYSLAATLHHLATGAEPPDVLKRSSELLRKRADPLPRADEVNPRVPTSVADILMRSLSIAPEERPQSASEMRKALAAPNRIADAADPADPDSYSETILASVSPKGAAPQGVEKSAQLGDQPGGEVFAIQIKDSEVGQVVKLEGSHNTVIGPSYGTARKGTRTRKHPR